MTYDSSDTSQISYGYDSQLRVSTYEATSSVLSGGYIRKASYEYFNDSRTKKVTNVLDSGFNQEYGYDSIGRISASASGTKVNSQNQNVMPFAQSLGYNAFGDLTERNTDIWGSGGGFAATYTNGHKDNSGEIYDAAGNTVDATTNSTNYKRWKFDASGRSVETAYRWYQSVPSPQIDRTETILKTYDGDGLDTKRVDTKDFILYPGGTQSTSSTEYYVRSTVLGGKLLTELDQAGAKKLTNVYAGDGVLAEQRLIGGTPGVFWRHEDPLTSSYRKIDQNGEEGGSLADSPANVEYDPLGGAIPTIDPLTDPLLSQPSSMRQFKSAGDVNRPEYGCIIDGEMRKDVGACNRALKHRIGHLNASFDQSSDALAEIGIVARWVPTNGKPRPDAPDSPDIIRVATQEPGGHWEYIFFDASYEVEGQTQTGPKLGSGVPTNIRKLVSDLAQRSDCSGILSKFADELGKKGKLDSIDDGKTFIESVFDNMKSIVVDPQTAGSGARTDGESVWLNDYSNLPKAHQNAVYAKYVLQELVHNFKSGNGNFSDSRLSEVAKEILNNMNNDIADKLRADFKKTGHKERAMLHHYLLNQFCQYSQKEVDDGYPQ